MTLSNLFQLYFLTFFLLPISTQNIPEVNRTSEESEVPVVHVTEYSTAIINVSWVDSKRMILHTDTSETGRFSIAGATTVSGILALAHSQVMSYSLEHIQSNLFFTCQAFKFLPYF